MSQEDKQFMQSVKKTTTFENGHYSIGLPLRNHKLPMPKNRCMAMEQRLASLRESSGRTLASMKITSASWTMSSGLRPSEFGRPAEPCWRPGCPTYHTTGCITLRRERYE
ncbi:hypothetical protein AAFF_G00009990 [Aldrovandia affinis]|uniref:Uncharacterized protein n=1 Tax=Aldrovandia affinis TaxID=143900 RepID=A0AAD7S723_9TELE|nr:hypothetical protein AAFF_G00009990 [Aldrovandia affinis]